MNSGQKNINGDNSREFIIYAGWGGILEIKMTHSFWYICILQILYCYIFYHSM